MRSANLIGFEFDSNQTHEIQTPVPTLNSNLKQFTPSSNQNTKWHMQNLKVRHQNTIHYETFNNQFNWSNC
jgi:hypothetical protein